MNAENSPYGVTIHVKYNDINKLFEIILRNPESKEIIIAMTSTEYQNFTSNCQKLLNTVNFNQAVEYTNNNNLNTETETLQQIV